MTADAYAARGRPTSTWRRRARKTILGVIESNGSAAPAALLSAVDAAYPFGERAHHPYKAWLAERRLLVGDLEPPPSLDEWGAIEVARDLVELGRAEEARTLLEEQAPGRHARRCPTCGRGKGRSCYEPTGETWTLGDGTKMPTGPDRLIPHAARVQP